MKYQSRVAAPPTRVFTATVKNMPPISSHNALAMTLTLYGHRIALYNFSRSASRLASTKERKLRLEFFVSVLHTCGSEYPYTAPPPDEPSKQNRRNRTPGTISPN